MTSLFVQGRRSNGEIGMEKGFVMRLIASIAIALAFGSLTASAQDDGKARLDEIRAAPLPATQTDLDTYKLASAHREQAASTEERTNGLWQSWLVSVCEGCGPKRKLYTDKDAEDLMRRAKSTRSDDQVAKSKQKYTYVKPDDARRSVSKAGLYTDLATENIDQIRRNPNR